MDAGVLMQQARRTNVVRTMRTLVRVLGLRSVVGLVYRQKSQLVGAVRADVAAQRLVGNWTQLLLLLLC